MGIRWVVNAVGLVENFAARYLGVLAVVCQLGVFRMRLAEVIVI